jgi:hypothetical protein
MAIDVYYSYENQDDFGMEVKTWTMDQTLQGYIEILGAVERDSLKSNLFFEYHDKLIGRTSKDPRISSSGIGYPLTSMLMTNIKDAVTHQEFYTEPTGKSTVYEVMAVEPYVNPWNEIEYYKVLLNRSDHQELKYA